MIEGATTATRSVIFDVTIAVHHGSKAASSNSREVSKRKTGGKEANGTIGGNRTAPTARKVCN